MEPNEKSSLTFRHAKRGDAGLLAAMNYQLICDEGHSNPMTLSELVARMKGWLAREYRGVVFERAEDVVGYALYRLEADSVYLRQFFVNPEYRRQGLGRAAMDILLTGIFPRRKRVTVDVLYQNHSAHEFWRAVGFTDYAVTLEMTNRP